MIVDILCEVPAMNRAIHSVVGEFAIDDWPDGFTPTTGVIRPYHAETVMRHLSPKARALGESEGLRDIYQEGVRFWLIDDRWGIVELNLLKNHFHAWVLPDTKLDMNRIIQDAVIWPMAQLLRGKGLHLVPAVSVSRDGWGMLVISQTNLEPELDALIHSGFRVVGQQWTALRMDGDRIEMLHMPGLIEHLPPPQLKAGVQIEQTKTWIDITQMMAGSSQHHSYCDAVLITESGRRALPSIRPVNRSQAVATLKQHWPIVELHPLPKSSALAAKLATDCKVFTATLSRNPSDLLKQLDVLRYGRNLPTIHPPKVHVQVAPTKQRQIPA